MVTRVQSKIDVDLDDFTNEVAVLIPDLINRKDFKKKIIAKNTLIYMGKAVLPQLNILLCSENYELRIIAARIIQQIKAEESIRMMLLLLNDDDKSIRWIAARGLILVGREAIIPLLRTLVKNGKSYYLKSGAHSVLTRLLTSDEREEFNYLLTSLANTNYTGIIATIEAAKALKKFRERINNKEEL